jgi:hypothetical protein
VTRYLEIDKWSKARKFGTTYPVKTVSLNDLLSKHGAPSTIDYLSMDTEGSEFDILKAFDFSRHRIKLITVEHNHTPERGKIFDLLTQQGFTRKLEALSQCDDWYVNTAVLAS